VDVEQRCGWPRLAPQCGHGKAPEAETPGRHVPPEPQIPHLQQLHPRDVIITQGSDDEGLWDRLREK